MGTTPNPPSEWLGVVFNDYALSGQMVKNREKLFSRIWNNEYALVYRNGFRP
jgi:hypothetical protein